MGIELPCKPPIILKDATICALPVRESTIYIKFKVSRRWFEPPPISWVEVEICKLVQLELHIRSKHGCLSYHFICRKNHLPKNLFISGLSIYAKQWI